jgi:uncharacterized protein YjbJ (UPF0337 family)
LVPALALGRYWSADGKGGIKKAAGSLTGNQRLKDEGRADQARAKIKDTLENIVDTVTGHNKK